MDKVLARAAAERAGDARAQPLGSGGHLRRARRLQGHRAEGHGQRQGLPGHRAVASRPGDRGRQLARRAAIRQRHRALLPPGDPPAVPRSVSEGRGLRRPTSRRSTAFETGTNTWRRLPSWPAGCASGCTVQPTPLYLSAQPGAAHSTAPKAGDAAFDEYVSDPAKPVPFRARPIQPVGYDNGMTWPQWLVDDQREASGRPDVLVFTSDVLTAPVKISGQPIANLVASTSGTDCGLGREADRRLSRRGRRAAGDGRLPAHGVGRHLPRPLPRELRDRRRPIAADTPLLYRFALPTANHVFLPGHRIMVQVQSSWFPLYDRNPQTFVPNIFWAQARRLPQGHAAHLPRAGRASAIELPMVVTSAAFPAESR